MSCCRYVFLLDSSGRVRWRGSGSASEDEKAVFLTCSHGALKYWRSAKIDVYVDADAIQSILLEMLVHCKFDELSGALRLDNSHCDSEYSTFQELLLSEPGCNCHKNQELQM